MTATAPREAWHLECVQEDRNNPLPCSAEDQKIWGKDGTGGPGTKPVEKKTEHAFGEPHEGESVDDALMREMMGGGAGDAGAKGEPGESADDALMREMMGGAKKDEPAAPKKPKGAQTDDELMEEMMNAGKKK